MHQSPQCFAFHRNRKYRSGRSALPSNQSLRNELCFSRKRNIELKLPVYKGE
jgi:hypothetical protein